jgi:hypothetical protein
MKMRFSFTITEKQVITKYFDGGVSSGSMRAIPAGPLLESPKLNIRAQTKKNVLQQGPLLGP